MGIRFLNLFTNDPVFQAAQDQFTTCDRVAAVGDAGWGLWPAPAVLNGRLLTKLANVPGTTVLISGVNRNRMPVGSTELIAIPHGATDQHILTQETAAGVRQWLGANPGAVVGIKVEVVATPSTLFAGTIVEILTHELAAHAEPFADFLIAEAAQAGSGVLDTEEQQHLALHQGNPRYRLIGAQYVTTYVAADQGQRFRVRMQQDTQANATLPPGV